MSNLQQAYEEILSEYNKMIQNIRRNEEISVILVYEIQKELFRMSEISGQDDDLRDVYKNMRIKEEIMKDIMSESSDSTNQPMIECHSLKEAVNSVSTLLRGISSEFQELVSTEDGTST